MTNAPIISSVTAAGVLIACLLACTEPARTGPLITEALAAVRDPGTQWMIFAGCLMNLGTLIVLEQRSTHSRFWHLWSVDLWQLGFLVLTAISYALDHQSAWSTNALVLIAGAGLGKATAVWVRWRGQDSGGANLNSGEGKSCDESGGAIECRTARSLLLSEGERGRFIMVILIFLVLAAAGLLKSKMAMQFQYRGQNRWSGPWENPNTFGILMGVGVVVAFGATAHSFKARVRIHDNQEQRGRRAKRWWWLQLVFLMVSIPSLSVALLKSYSRGALLATVCGFFYLVFLWTRDSLSQEDRVVTPHPRKGVIIVVVACAFTVLSFWNFRYTEWVGARRAFSFTNVNDFSWRNRLAAWEGALQMLGARPWLGFGWDQPELYGQYYRNSKVGEDMAIQTNDYLMLGGRLGLPTLFSFVVYIWLSFRRGAQAKSRGQLRESRGEESEFRNLISAGAGLNWLPMTCQAGVVVLLVGFWFDGGLFTPAMAGPFWILLGLGPTDTYSSTRVQPVMQKGFRRIICREVIT